MVKKKIKKGTVVITIFILILAALIIFICRCISLAFTDNIRDKYTMNETADNTFLKSLLIGAAFGKEFEMGETEFNTYINNKYCTDYKSSGSGVDHIMIYFYDDVPSEVYAHIFINGSQFAIHSKLEFSLDSGTNILSVKLFDAYIGELGIPDSILSFILSKISENKEHISVSGTTLNITAKYTYKIKSYDIDLCIEEFIPKDGSVLCKTKALKVAVEYITSDEGKKMLSGIYDKIKDKFFSRFS